MPNYCHYKFLHAKKRAKERCSLDLTEELHQQFINIIESKRILGKKHTCKEFVVKFHHNRSTYYIIYDRKRKQIITFLTRDMYIKRMIETDEQVKNRLRNK